MGPRPACRRHLADNMPALEVGKSWGRVRLLRTRTSALRRGRHWLVRSGHLVAPGAPAPAAHQIVCENAGAARLARCGYRAIAGKTPPHPDPAHGKPRVSEFRARIGTMNLDGPPRLPALS